MLTRRHLRKKVLEALYSLRQGGIGDIPKNRQSMLKSIESIYELFVWQLEILAALRKLAQNKIELRRQKKIPTFEDLNPNTKFAENKILEILEKSPELDKLSKKYKISSEELSVYSEKMLKKIEEDKDFKAFMESSKSGFIADKQFVVFLFKNIIAPDEVVLDFYENKSIGFYNDLQIANTMTLLTIESIEQDGSITFPSLYKDEYDKDFAVKLFDFTAMNYKDWDEMIVSKLENWEPDRVAILDIILMEMAITEFVKFPSIPIKVTLNEYIELAKDYSTEKSKIFINGVLDKILITLNEKGAIKKSGRGLI